MILSPRGGSYASFSPHPHLPSHSVGGSAASSSTTHHFPPPSLHSSSSADHLEQPHHHFHTPHLLPPSSLSAASPSSASSSASSSPHSLQSPDGAWGSSGKLKAAARAIFERAYGLNGRAREEHGLLCEEVMRLTACSQKSFEELVYGHSYDGELCDLRAQVVDYRPREAKKRPGGRGTAKKRKEDDAAPKAGALMPLFPHAPAGYGGVSTPVSASRYELTFGAGGPPPAPRRKSLDASLLGLYSQQGLGQGQGQGHAYHHGHAASSAVFPSSLSSSFFSSTLPAPAVPSPSPSPGSGASAFAEYDGAQQQSQSHLSHSSTPSHSTLRHRANFSSAAAAAAAAADSVVAYVQASAPTPPVTAWTFPPGLSSPKNAQHTAAPVTAGSAQQQSLSTFALMAGSALSAVASATSASSSASSSASASSSGSTSLRPTLVVSSPSSSSSVLAASTTLAPVTLASIKSTVGGNPAVPSKLTTPSPAPSAPSDSSRSSSRSNTPLPPSPSSQPPRPVSISIPNSPAVSNEEADLEDPEGGEALGHGSVERKERNEDDDEGEAERNKRSEKQLQQQQQQDGKSRQSRDGNKRKAATRPASHRDERKERSSKPSSAAVHPLHAADSPASPSSPSSARPSVDAVAAAPRAPAVVLPVVEPPVAVDFSGISLPSSEAAPLSSLLARSALSCVVLTALRLCTTYASAVPSSLDYQTALSLFLALTVSAVVLLTRSTLAPPLSSSPLSSLLAAYVQSWSLVASDEPAQLLAAYGQLQQLTLASAHSMYDHAAAVLRFLDAAHRRLHLDLGYSLLVDRLFTQAAAIQAALPPAAGERSTQPGALSVPSSSLLPLLVAAPALLAYVLLPMHALSLSASSLSLHVLLPFLAVLLVILTLVGSLEERRRETERCDDVRSLLHLARHMDGRMAALRSRAPGSAETLQPIAT